MLFAVGEKSEHFQTDHLSLSVLLSTLLDLTNSKYFFLRKSQYNVKYITLNIIFKRNDISYLHMQSNNPFPINCEVLLTLRIA